MVYLLILFNTVLLVTGQLLWKIAVEPVTVWSFKTLVDVIFSIQFIGGAVLYVIATGLWLVIISKLPLSVAYPMQSISYIVGAVAAFFVFKESIQPSQWIGMLVIVLGVYLIAK